MKRLILFLSLIGLIGIFYFTLPDNQPKVIVCDVGQGDAILAEYKNIQILFDVGPDNKKVLRCLENHMPFWDKTIEVVILSHGDSDHTGGLDDVFKSYKVGKFFSNGYLDEDIEQKISSEKISQNDVISLSLFDFEVVWPEENLEKEEPAMSAGRDGNENSVAGILKVKNSDWSMFLTGDMEMETEQKLVWRNILNSPVTVLKVSHHGSKTATSQELLEIIRPKIGVISVGKNNRFGHPVEEVLERLESVGSKIRRTDLVGEVVLEVY